MIATVHRRTIFPPSEALNGMRQRMVSIGKARYASNQDAQSGGAIRGVSNGAGANGANLSVTRTTEYASPINIGSLLEVTDCLNNAMRWPCPRSILANHCASSGVSIDGGGLTDEESVSDGSPVISS